MQAWASLGVISLLFVVPACGTVSRRTVSQIPAPQAGVGASTDAGYRWLGAEPVGGLVVETAPRVQGTRSQPATSPRAQPIPPAPPAANGRPAAPLPGAAPAPAARPGGLWRTPKPPPPPAWPKTPPLPPPPGSAAAWRPLPREPMPPPLIEHAGAATGLSSSDGGPPERTPVAVPTAPSEMVVWAPVGGRDPSAPLTDSASLEGPPSGILPPPVIRRSR